MKIIVKNLKGSQFEIDIEPSHTVQQVKDKIQEEQKIDAASQKLVWVGKVMADDKTIEEYKLKEGDFIVVMVAKAKPVKEKKPEAAPVPVPQPTGTAAAGSMPAFIPSQPGSSTTNVPSPVPNPGSSGDSHPEGGAGGVIPSGEQLESILVEMESMGFPRDEWMRALRAAFYNPDRAVDYLLNGIPDNPEPQERPSAGGNMPSAPTGDMGDNPLAFLQNNPMFSQLRDRIIREPAFFQTFMNQLAQTQPQLHQAISQNPQQFLQLLLGGAGGGMGEAPDSDPPGTIRVTQEEKDAIERLTSLGFPKHRAIEAFFACDKNEEWAANYLFENGGNDDQYDQDVVQEESMADAQNSGIIPPEFEGDAFMPEDYPENPAASDDMALDNPVLDALQNNPPAQQDPPAEQDQPAEEAPAENAPANKDNGNNANNDNNDDEDGSCL